MGALSRQISGGLLPPGQLILGRLKRRCELLDGFHSAVFYQAVTSYCCPAWALSAPGEAAPSSPDSLCCSLNPLRAPQPCLHPLPPARPWELGDDLVLGVFPPYSLNSFPYDVVFSVLSSPSLEEGAQDQLFCSGPAILLGGVFEVLWGG